MNREFNREDHVFKSEAFEEIIKNTIRFFNGTPVIKLPPPIKFHGTGVYAIYYIGGSEIYRHISDKNRLEFSMPIYIGKAVPGGWRQARVEKIDGKVNHELFRRLLEHEKSIHQAKNLKIEDFTCRFMILEGVETNLIGTVEAALIRHYKPMWNSVVDGFGNHDPGSGRYNQAKSDWDVLHPGRPWADKCLGVSSSQEQVMGKIFRSFKRGKD
ncbi:MAG: Eco29kI family restriction endonuclease [Saprospiraceae bacterium]